MNNYMIDAFIPNTEYKTAICWSSDEKLSKSKIDEVLKICSDGFALMYGWDNNLFIENDDNAIPKDEYCESKYNEVLVLFLKNIKYKVYKMTISNVNECDDLCDATLNNRKYTTILANDLAECVVGCTYTNEAKEIVVLIDGELNYINPDSYILNNGVKEYYVYDKLGEHDACVSGEEHILDLKDN